MFKQQGAVNLSVPETIDSSILISQIKGALLSHGASDIETINNTIIFKGGHTPFKTNINPLMPISSGTLELYGNKGFYHAKYTVNLMHLLFWAVVSIIGIFLIVITNNQLQPEHVFSGIAAGFIGLLFVYFGYYGATSTRFPSLLRKAVENEKQS